MKTIQELENQISLLQEPEIGDFRRRCALYINRLIKTFHTNSKEKKMLEEIKHIILNQKFEDIEDLRDLLLEKIQNIK